MNMEPCIDKKTMKPVIGLTGPSGAGKSTVAAKFAAFGIPVIDADAVYHQLLIPPSPCLDALVREFSPKILAADSTHLDRAALAALVFEDSDLGRARRARLNEITHFFVKEESDRLLRKYRADGAPAVLIDAPLLIEAEMHRMCDLTVCVLAPMPVRIRRLMARDDRSEDAIRARIAAQPDDDFYLSHADVVIRTDDTTDADQLTQAVHDCLVRVGVLS